MTDRSTFGTRMWRVGVLCLLMVIIAFQTRARMETIPEGDINVLFLLTLAGVVLIFAGVAGIPAMRWLHGRLSGEEVSANA